MALEKGFATDVAEALTERGHSVRFESFEDLFGGAQLILKTNDGYIGGSDHRKEGLAAGF